MECIVQPLTLCIQETYKQVLFQTVNKFEMQHNAAFHQCLL